MDLFSIIVIAIGLSMDTFAVSIVNGLTMPALRFSKAVVMALVMALFQAAMPLLGWYAGFFVQKEIESVDHWVAFGLLAFIGLKMIRERGDSIPEKVNNGRLKWSVLVYQSIATSIDALAVGISFALLEINIISSVMIIGAATFLFAMIGLKLGKSIGGKIRSNIELIGGLILILIGIKILIEHLFIL